MQLTDEPSLRRPIVKQCARSLIEAALAATARHGPGTQPMPALSPNTSWQVDPAAHGRSGPHLGMQNPAAAPGTMQVVPAGHVFPDPIVQSAEQMRLPALGR